MRDFKSQAFLNGRMGFNPTCFSEVLNCCSTGLVTTLKYLCGSGFVALFKMKSRAV